MTGPLTGIRALVTRPAGQALALVQAIRTASGVAVEFPLLEIVPLATDDRAERATLAATLNALDEFVIAIFASSNAVQALFDELQRTGGRFPSALCCLAVGAATAQRLREAGIACAGGEATMDSEELLARPELAAVAGQRIVIFRGVGGREHLADELTARGASVTRCALYRRRAPAASPAQLHEVLTRERINTVLLSSGEGLANLLALLGGSAAGTIASQLAVVTPGERVASLARSAGFATVHAAANATDAAMLALLRAVAAPIRERTSTA